MLLSKILFPTESDSLVRNSFLTAVGTVFDSFVAYFSLYALFTFVIYIKQLNNCNKKKTSTNTSNPSNEAQVAWTSRIISVVNAVCCVYGAYQMVFSSEVGRSALHRPVVAVFSSAYASEGIPGDSRSFHLALFAGYIAYDLVLCLRHECLRDAATLLHHAVVLVALLVSLKFDLITLYIAALMFNEASTPFLNFRYFLYKAGLEDSLAYLCNGVGLFLSFFVFRALLITGIVIHIAYAWHHVGFQQGYIYSEPAWRVAVAIFLTFLASLHWLINIYWFSIIFNKTLEALTIPYVKNKDVCNGNCGCCNKSQPMKSSADFSFCNKKRL
mmetsp:Transcript_18696/g.24677  ORF Transcript_18696/g.24677 Transcript_18696/m.24677 type:complete len:328 (-) Transcript_18696:19-1002(-)